MRRVRGLMIWAIPVMAVCCTVAQAQEKKPIGQDPGQEVVMTDADYVSIDLAMKVNPVRYAKMDEHGQVVDQWYDYPEVLPTEDCGAFLCFDEYEEDSATDLPSDGFYGLNCNKGSARYRASDSTRRVVTIDDITKMAGGLNGGCSGVEFGRVQLAFWWQVTGSGSSERCVIQVSTLETWEGSGNCTSAGFVDSVAFDLGVLNSSATTGAYYFIDVPLCLLTGNPTLLSPADGVGAYKIVLAKDENLTLATMAQPMIWGTGKPLNQTSQMRRTHYDNNNNGAVDSGECVGQSQTDCPTPLGTMVAFWRKGTETLPHMRANCDTRRLTGRYWGYEPGERVQFKVDGGNTNATVANRKGKGKAVYKVEDLLNFVGPHTIECSSDRTWTIQRNVSCPAG